MLKLKSFRLDEVKAEKTEMEIRRGFFYDSMVPVTKIEYKYKDKQALIDAMNDFVARAGVSIISVNEQHSSSNTHDPEAGFSYHHRIFQGYELLYVEGQSG